VLSQIEAQKIYYSVFAANKLKLPANARPLLDFCPAQSVKTKKNRWLYGEQDPIR